MKYFILLFGLFYCISFSQTAYDYNHSGCEDIKNEDYLNAKINFEKAIKLDKKYSFSYYNLGLLYELIDKDISTALLNYEKASLYDPDNKDIHYKLIELFYKARKYDKSISACKKALSMSGNVDTTIIFEWLGYNYTQLNKNIEAKSYFKKAIKLTPNNGTLLYAIGKFYFDREEYSEAKYYIKEAALLGNPSAVISYIQDIKPYSRKFLTRLDYDMKNPHGTSVQAFVYNLYGGYDSNKAEKRIGEGLSNPDNIITLIKASRNYYGEASALTMLNQILPNIEQKEREFLLGLSESEMAIFAKLMARYFSLPDVE